MPDSEISISAMRDVEVPENPYREKVQDNVEKEVKQQLELFRFLEMAKEQLTSSTPEMLANVFNFEEMDYSVGIKIYRKVLEKMGIHKDMNELYEGMIECMERVRGRR